MNEPTPAAAPAVWHPPAAARRGARDCFVSLIPDLDALAVKYRVEYDDVVDAEIFEVFVDLVHQITGDLAAVCDCRDEAAARRQGHSLEGVGGTVGFPEISVVGAMLITAVKEGRWEFCRDLAGRLLRWRDLLNVPPAPLRTGS
jgi:hypothetical protein